MTPNEIYTHNLYDNIQLDHYRKNIDNCIENLLAIGKAIQTFYNDHDDFPQWLSDLQPDYLSDKQLLVCPADEKGGEAVASFNADPKKQISYEYQFHSKYRDAKSAERQLYGDDIPLVRCRHHDFLEYGCLNLSFSFKVYRSLQIWESQPEDIYGTPEVAVDALENGIQNSVFNADLHNHIYIALSRLYVKLGREKEADNVITRYKLVIPHDSIWCHLVLISMLEMRDRQDEAFSVIEELQQRFPDNYRVLNKLAEMHWNQGNSELAKEYHYKITSDLELIGKPVSDFSATDLDGNGITLQDYRGKVVLLNFWEIGCGFCREEIPNIKKVYNTYKSKGFDVIGVSLDKDEVLLRNYLNENGIRWKQIYSEKGDEGPLVKKFKITSLPTPWLIDRNGILISTDARGIALEKLVEELVE